MKNILSSHNKGDFGELKNHGIIVIFLSIQYPNELSISDIFFFAVYKKYWYDQLLYINSIEK